MFSNFSEAIKLRKKDNIKSEFTFIGVKAYYEKNFILDIKTLFSNNRIIYKNN